MFANTGLGDLIYNWFSEAKGDKCVWLRVARHSSRICAVCFVLARRNFLTTQEGLSPLRVTTSTNRRGTTRLELTAAATEESALSVWKHQDRAEFSANIQAGDVKTAVLRRSTFVADIIKQRAATKRPVVTRIAERTTIIIKKQN